MLKRTDRKGFTLIELLVVMAIILILAGLLTPGLMGAKRQAGKVSCANNLKQVGAALEMYAGNNNDTYPTVANFSAGLSPAYIDNAAVLNCPVGNNLFTYVQPNSATPSTTVVASCTTPAVHGAGSAVQLYKGGNVRIQ